MFQKKLRRKEEALKYRPEYDMKVIGENLKRLREAKSLSVKDVQEYLRLGSVQAIYKYENGKGYPQVDTMFALMELYEADLCDIICKHKVVVCSFIEENREPSSVMLSYRMKDFDAEIEIMNIETYKERLAKRLQKYM